MTTTLPATARTAEQVARHLFAQLGIGAAYAHRPSSTQTRTTATAFTLGVRDFDYYTWQVPADADDTEDHDGCEATGPRYQADQARVAAARAEYPAFTIRLEYEEKNWVELTVKAR